MLRLKSHQDNLEQKIKERTAELECSGIDNTWRPGDLAEFHDEDTGNHILRVGLYCKAVAEQLEMGQDFTERLFLTSPLHDIGKVGITDDILLKPGKLNPEQWETMKQHCVIGAEIFYKDSGIMKLFFTLQENYAQMVNEDGVNPLHKMAATIALTHHEKWNGTGYPKGLAGKYIPFESRITAIADVYDALSSARPYKPAFSESKVRSIIAEEAGMHFDPEVYDAFEKSAEQFRDIKARFTD